LKNKVLYAVAVAAMLASAVQAKLPSKPTKLIAVNRQTQAPPIQDESSDETPLRDGIYTIPDGSCVRLTVIDQGYTYVTIDAKGTLHPMKNNIIETVSVDCP
jgi:hypothetical protein